MSGTTSEQIAQMIMAVLRETASKGRDAIYLPTARKQSNLTPLQKALHWTFERSTAWLLTMSRLEIMDFQASCTGCRSILENLFDIEALNRWPTDAEKWHRFEFMNRFRHSEKIAKLTQEHPTLETTGTKAAAAVSTNANNIAQYASWQSTWGMQIPRNHWRGGSIFSLAEELGPSYQLRYEMTYHLMSIGTHSGPMSAYVQTPADTASAFAYANFRGLEFYVESIELISQQLGQYFENQSIAQDQRKVLNRLEKQLRVYS